MKKRISIAIVAMLCACCLAFVACGGSSSSAASASGSAASSASSAGANADEQAIIKDIEDNATWFEAGKNEMASEIAKDEETAALFKLVGLDVNDYAKAVVDVMKMKCGKVTVDGDKAVAELLMTIPDYDAMSAEMDKALEEADLNSAKSEEEALAMAGEALLKAVESAPTKEISIDVDYIKKNNKWEVADADKVKSAMEKAFV